MEEKTMNLQNWLEYFEKNPGTHYAILRGTCRKRRYSLEYDGELEDLMQSAVEKMLEVFSKEKEIKEIYKHTSFLLACRNAVNQHIWGLNRFHGLPWQGLPPEHVSGEKINPMFSGDGERIAVSPDDYNIVDFKIDAERILQDPIDVKICKMLLQGHTHADVGFALKMTQPSVSLRLGKIRKRLKKAGLHSA